MLKAFEELENAIKKYLDREEKRGKSAAAPADPQVTVDNEEAAELIRRAIKRLKAL